MNKVSIRFFNDREIRAVWDDAAAKWWFSVLDVVGALNNEPDYAKTRNYWKYLKAKLKREKSELVSATTQLKLAAADGKRYKSDALDADGIVALAKAMPNNRAAAFLDWFLYSDNTIDAKSKQKAYALFESGMFESIEPGTVKGLQQIHAYLFADFTILRDRSGRRTFRRADSPLRTPCISRKHCLRLNGCRRHRSAKSSTSTWK